MGLKEKLIRFGSAAHARLIKLTGGLGGGTDDGSVLVLTHRGARTGKARETPLMFVRHGNGYAVAASKGGAPEHPAWYHNLMANPDSDVRVGRQDVEVHASVIAGEERAEVWRRFVATGGQWETYEQKTDRVIPLIHLEPR